VLDTHERDRAKVRNDTLIGDKAVNAVRRLECDAQALFCHDGVKVASNWMSNLAGAWPCTASAPEEALPNSVSQEAACQYAPRIALSGIDSLARREECRRLRSQSHADSTMRPAGEMLPMEHVKGKSQAKFADAR